MKYVLKNSKGQYFTMTEKGMACTPLFKEAFAYTKDTAAIMAKAYNARFKDDMSPVPRDSESLQYYTKNIYHAFDEGDALRTVTRVRNGKYVEYDDAITVNLQGLWFVYAHPVEAVSA